MTKTVLVPVRQIVAFGFDPNHTGGRIHNGNCTVLAYEIIETGGNILLHSRRLPNRSVIGKADVRIKLDARQVGLGREEHLLIHTQLFEQTGFPVEHHLALPGHVNHQPVAFGLHSGRGLRHSGRHLGFGLKRNLTRRHKVAFLAAELIGFQ